MPSVSFYLKFLKFCLCFGLRIAVTSDDPENEKISL